MLTHGCHTKVIQRVGALMQSPSWAYLTEDDQFDILKVATLVCRRPDGGSVLKINWRLYLAALTGRITLRKHERMASGRAA